jgi:hypothetical protein
MKKPGSGPSRRVVAADLDVHDGRVRGGDRAGHGVRVGVEQRAVRVRTVLVGHG